MSEPTDCIVLRGIAAEAIVGVYDFERHQPRPVPIDLTLWCDLRAAAASDDVAETIDYDGVTQTVHQVCATLQPALIETLAGTIATRLLGDARIRAVTVTVHKPGAVAGVEDIAVRLHRSQAEHP
ncbi:dihydroneopterin aldolase [Algiphilus sp.]|uniref:dihydroneopterin aldolase n=1 Tax=Algiphilus sp. TaxID=1872431 RepID=UPI0032EDF1CD